MATALNLVHVISVNDLLYSTYVYFYKLLKYVQKNITILNSVFLQVIYQHSIFPFM